MFDEEPDDTLHGECAAEIRALKAKVERMREALARYEVGPVMQDMRALEARAEKAETKAIEAERVLAALADLTQQQAEEWNRERDALRAAHEAALALAAAHEKAADQAEAEVERLKATVAYRAP